MGLKISIYVVVLSQVGLIQSIFAQPTSEAAIRFSELVYRRQHIKLEPNRFIDKVENLYHID